MIRFGLELLPAKHLGSSDYTPWESTEIGVPGSPSDSGLARVFTIQQPFVARALLGPAQSIKDKTCSTAALTAGMKILLA